MIHEQARQVPFQVQILDYSPEWDYTTGGSKILFCIRPGIDQISDEDFESRFECSFGDAVVPIKFIQPGVFKCKAPPHRAGFVPLNLMYNGDPLNSDQDMAQFEYRELRPKRKKTKKLQLGGYLLHGDTGAVKVRVIERLQTIDSRVPFASDCSMKENDVCEEIMAKAIEIIEKADVKELDAQDSDGISLIHYFAALDNSEAIKVLAQRGCSINPCIKGTDITPLKISAARGYEGSVKTLINFGAQILADKSEKKQSKKSLEFQEQKEKLDREFRESRGYGSSVDSMEFDSQSRGSSAVDFALQNNHNDIVECLLRELTLRSVVEKKDSATTKKPQASSSPDDTISHTDCKCPLVR